MKPSQHYHEFWLGFAFGALGVAAFVAAAADWGVLWFVR
jgi:hypothetical protein